MNSPQTGAGGKKRHDAELALRQDRRDLVSFLDNQPHGKIVSFPDPAGYGRLNRAALDLVLQALDRLAQG